MLRQSGSYLTRLRFEKSGSCRYLALLGDLGEKRKDERVWAACEPLAAVWVR